MRIYPTTLLFISQSLQNAAASSSHRRFSYFLPYLIPIGDENNNYPLF